jgi:hypothetical protein
MVVWYVNGQPIDTSTSTTSYPFVSVNQQDTLTAMLYSSDAVAARDILMLDRRWGILIERVGMSGFDAIYGEDTGKGRRS